MPSSPAKIASVVAAYFAVSISLVFVNKWLMTSNGASIPAPLFVTWYQCVVTVAICWLLGRMGKDARPGDFVAQFPEVEFDFAIAKKIVPLSVVFVGMMTFNNLTLKYVEVSFYNIARSLTICFNVALTWYLLGDRTSSRTILCLAVVVLGFVIGNGTEVNFSLAGTIFGVTSSVFVSLNSIMTKRVQDAVDKNKWKLSAYNNINACVMFIPFIILTGEWDIVLDHFPMLFSPYFWTMMTLSGVFGFLIGIVTIMQIQVTSPLTHNISGTAKSGLQTALAFMIWKNPTSLWNVLSTFMVLGGSLAYSYVRTLEMRETEARTAHRSTELPEVAREESGSDVERQPLKRTDD